MAKMIMTNFYCLDCGAVNSILISEIDQFSSEHNIINTKAIKHENYEPNTISDLRDYYFRLLMNYYDFNFSRLTLCSILNVKTIFHLRTPVTSLSKFCFLFIYPKYVY